MRNILILLTVIFMASCASTNSKKEHKGTETVDNTATKAPESTIDDKEIHWMSLEEALKKQQEAPKKIFMDTYTKWCGPCKRLDRNTFHDPSVVKYVNEHYYAVKFDAEGPEPITFKDKVYKNPNYVEGKRGRNGVHEFTIALGVDGYPMMIFLDEKANMITSTKGYLLPQQLEIYLKLVAQNDYKKIDSDEKWNAYQKAFVPEF